MTVLEACDVLGVSAFAEPEALKGAYRAMSAKYHPDREGGDESRMKEITQAYALLTDPSARREAPPSGYTVRERRPARRTSTAAVIRRAESVPAVAMARDGAVSLAVGDGRPLVAVGVLAGLLAFMLSHGSALTVAVLFLAYLPASFPTGIRVWARAGSWSGPVKQKLCPYCGRSMGEVLEMGVAGAICTTVVVAIMGAVWCPFETGWVIGSATARRLPQLRG